jgi:hypothetical protein
MTRAIVVIEGHPASGGSFHTIARKQVGSSGAYSVSIRHKAGTYKLRWYYQGSPSQRWRSTASPAHTFRFS